MIIFSLLQYNAIFYFIYYITMFVVRKDLINEFNQMNRSIFLYHVCNGYIFFFFNGIIFSTLNYDGIFYFTY